MSAALQWLAFAGAAVTAVGVIAVTVAPQWRRILRLAAGHVELPEQTDRWRQVHLAGDRARPFQIRAADRSHRRGLLGRRSR